MKNEEIKKSKKSQVREQELNLQEEGQSKKGFTACGILSVDYWAEYFDFEQADLKNRMMACMVPYTNTFLELTFEKPDLYGPFWISTSLIMLLTISQSLSGVIANLFTVGEKKVTVEPFDFNKIGMGMSIVYGSFFIFPLVFLIINKFLGVKMSLTQASCTFGYSLLVFIAAGVVSIIPLSFLRILAFLAAGAHSFIFLCTNFKS